MTYIRSLFPIAGVTTTIPAPSVWATVDDPNDSRYRAQSVPAAK